ncbi:HTH domain-containing protein [Sphingomonas histidinilytica]|uniref:HTH domain-containing protein n=1 Tax=Rhizorhabdus histidinilytica TaxID=439228 RepID=A0A1T4ZUY4_9SPHN|nr:HTH domain-containing protein [Rhizorhabdus histidinilytica]MBO9377541.1 HTH domain-containing protein [Rhizorhabdus histidinilytica]SKB26561.1 HTH domain-containing protein [Rhizorhabdus histidinilytica]
MDSLVTAAARSLAMGDPLGALNRVALREDPAALALRGIAMAQLGDLPRARELLRRGARAFGAREPVARARCLVAQAEIALVSRDLAEPMRTLGTARAVLAEHGDRANAAHAGYLEARCLLLIGRLDEAGRVLDSIDADALPPVSRPGPWLVAAGIAMRRIEAGPARAALDRAVQAARRIAVPALVAEVERAVQAFEAPAARLHVRGEERLLLLGDVEAVLASGMLVVNACRNLVRAGDKVVPLGSRPVLFALVRALAQAWPGDVSREELLAQAFRAREADESHRGRLRVEIGRLRAELGPLAELHATERGFLLQPRGGATVGLLLPPHEEEHAALLALLADGEAWSSSALALALGVSARTVQRALEALAAAGKADCFGRGRACRWTARQVPGFPTSLLLPAALPVG